MQRVLFLKLIFLICLFSCKKDDFNNPNPENNKQLKALKAPGIIRNDLAKGKLALPLVKIVSKFESDSQRFEFSYLPNTDKLQKIEYIVSACNYISETFHYRSDSLIDYIEAEMHNSFDPYCSGTIKRYNYTYKDGYLQSIIFKNTVAVNEKYFSYDEQGRVNKMFWSIRGLRENFFGYNEVELFYDYEGNIVKQKSYSANPGSTSYTNNIEYDGFQNPLQGYVFTGELRYIGEGWTAFNIHNQTSSFEFGIQKYTYKYDFLGRVIERDIEPKGKYVYHFFYR